MRVDLIKVLYNGHEIYALKLKPKAGNKSDIFQFSEYCIRQRKGFEQYHYLSPNGWSDEIYRFPITPSKVGQKRGNSQISYLHVANELMQWLNPGVVELQLGEEVHSFWLRADIEWQDTLINWHAPLVVAEESPPGLIDETPQKTSKKTGKKTSQRQSVLNPISQPKSSNKIPVVIVGVVILLLLGAAGMFWFSQQNRSLDETVAQAATTPPNTEKKPQPLSPSTRAPNNTTTTNTTTTLVASDAPPLFEVNNDNAVLPAHQMSLQLDILANDRAATSATLQIQSCDAPDNVTQDGNRLTFHRPVVENGSDRYSFNCTIVSNGNTKTTRVTVRVEALKLSLPLDKQATQLNLHDWLQTQTGWSLDAVNCIEQMLPDQGVEMINESLVYDSAVLANLPSDEKTMLCSLSTHNEWLPVTLQL